ncbi:MAG: hypothetical protein K2X39_08370 [Silvanigrellaceae bacterium]|nr:hypothetical protein [Silvanigrellaceae bacterium]
MAVNLNDTLWTRTGTPVKVLHVQPHSGKLILDEDFDHVQENTKFGIKNALSESEREAFNTNLTEVKSKDKKQEIEHLFQKIKALRNENADPRLIKYLDCELQFLMIREKYMPEKYETDPLNLGS